MPPVLSKGGAASKLPATEPPSVWLPSPETSCRHTEKTPSQSDTRTLRRTMRGCSTPCQRAAAVFTPRRVSAASPFHFTVWEPISLQQSVVTRWRRTAQCRGACSWRKACVQIWLCFHKVRKNRLPVDHDCVYRGHSTTDTIQQLTRLHFDIFLSCPALPFVSTMVWLSN